MEDNQWTEFTDHEKKIILEWLDLFLHHPPKAFAFFQEHKELINRATHWHDKTRDEWIRECARKRWEEYFKRDGG